MLETDKTIIMVIGVIITALMVPVGISAINAVDFTKTPMDHNVDLENFSTKYNSTTSYGSRSQSYINLVVPASNTSFYFNISAVTMIAASRNLTLSFTSTNMTLITDNLFNVTLLINSVIIFGGEFNLTDIEKMEDLPATALIFEIRGDIKAAFATSFTLTLTVEEEYIRSNSGGAMLNTLFTQVLPLMLIIGVIFGITGGIMYRKNGDN